MATLLDLVKTLNKTKKAAEYNPHSGDSWYKVRNENNGLQDIVAGLTGTMTNKDMAQLRYNADESALQREREDTSIQRGVADAQAAGVNPAAIYGNIAAPASAGNTAPSLSSGSLNLGEIIELIKLPQAMRIAKHQDEMAAAKNNAEVGNIVADTELKKNQATSLSNQNEWFVDTRNLEKDYLELRNQGAQKANDLTDAQIDNARATLPVIQEQLNNLQQDTGVKIMEQLYKQASIEQITRMMPYQMALLSAQTEQAQAAAALAIVQEAYQQKLIDDGYIDALCEQMRQQAVASGAAANQAEINTAIAEFKHALRTGHAFDSMPKWIRWLPNSIVAGFVNSVEIAAPIAAPVLGFAAAGRALRGRTAPAAQYQSVPGVSDGTTYGIPGY